MIELFLLDRDKRIFIISMKKSENLMLFEPGKGKLMNDK